MEDIKKRISNLLKQEAENILRSDNELSDKASNINIIFNLQKILLNYDELEPTLKDFFTKKAQKDKWERGNED